MRRPISCLLLTAVISLSFAAGASARSVNSVPFSTSEIAFSPTEVAPLEACAGQTATSLSAEEQATVMLCMTNYARAGHGLGRLTLNSQLGLAAEQKSIDIIGCDEFSHYACGRPFAFWDRRFGYLKGCWKVAENIAWGTGSDATVRAIFTAWLESPEHHENILGPYKEIGISLRIGRVESDEGAAVWTEDFGSHQC
jgi:uncharacterized protein YkwD